MASIKSIWRSLLRSLGIIPDPREPWPPKQRRIWREAKAYVVSKVGFDFPNPARVYHVPGERVVRGKWTARSTSSDISCGQYDPGEDVVRVVVAPDGSIYDPAWYVEQARHELAHCALFKVLGTMDHVPEFRKHFAGWAPV